MTPGFELEIRDTLLAMGRTDETAVRLWLRDGRARPLTLELSNAARDCLFRGPLPAVDPAADHTVSVTYPDDFPPAPPLAPGTAYRVRILDPERRTLESGRFETAPARDRWPDRFAIGLGSCHQPFAKDGSISQDATRLLRSLEGVLNRYGVKRMLLMGDQMYTDYPPSRSLYDEAYFASIAPPGRSSLLECTREEVRRIMHGRYRTYWSIPSFNALQSAFPCYPMLDDHEIVDNFGSCEEHSSEAWQRVAAGALDAFGDYQMARMAPLPAASRAHYYSWEYGPVACFVMDLRSEKRRDGDRIQMYSDEQLAALEQYLAARRNFPVMLLVLTVPLAHVPDPAAKVAGKLLPSGNDVEDRWSHPAAHPARERLIDLLARHHRQTPDQKLLLLGGDVHVGSAAFLHLNGTRPAYQLVSSALTNRESELLNQAIAALPRMLGKLRGSREELEFELMKGIAGHDRNPVTRLNAGIVEFIRDGDTYRLVLRLLSANSDGEVEVAFQSEPL